MNRVSYFGRFTTGLAAAGVGIFLAKGTPAWARMHSHMHAATCATHSAMLMNGSNAPSAGGGGGMMQGGMAQMMGTCSEAQHGNSKDLDRVQALLETARTATDPTESRKAIVEAEGLLAAMRQRTMHCGTMMDQMRHMMKGGSP
ncbi:MAG: hypothetical protein KGR26_04745 [Cyanobacteria bacterium REEB65]|nr:hypothetical protein [Cyanobacteria bacterium REEB65]